MIFFHKRVDLPGSEKHLPPSCDRLSEADGGSLVSVTIVLRRQGHQPAVAPGFIPRVSRAEFVQRLAADPKDILLVENFAHHHHLSVAEASLEKRRVMLRGTAHNMGKAFGTKLATYRNNATNAVFRGRSGPITLPDELKDIVIAVLGLDDRQAAFAHFIKSNAVPAVTFSPIDLATLYNFPKGLDGSGQTIAIVELGGGYTTGDLQAYFQGLGVKAPNVTAVSVDGGLNSPGDPADSEVLLDIEVAGAIAPAANIAVYFAPNTDQGFVDAITDAVHDSARKPSVISISWGAAEDSWTQQARTAMNAALQDAAALGVSVTIASGDNGSTDGVADKKLHVDFPSASPFALACGGTTLKASGGKVTSETVWNQTANGNGATGGGVSKAFALPPYQQGSNVPKHPETAFVGRGVPDVSGVADPTTGYRVFINGQNAVIGGTSAVSPLWAGLIALMNQKLGSSVGFLQPRLYSLGEAVFSDIQSGNNDDAKTGFYQARAGWDPCTGLGSPNGQALLDALMKASSATAAKT